MTIDEKIRYGMFAVGGASIVLTALGLHVGPITNQVVGGIGD
jgi:hypothetical protein